MDSKWKRPTFKELIGAGTGTSEVVFKGKTGSVHVTFVSSPTNKKQLNTVKVEMEGDEADLYEKTVQAWKDLGKTVISN